MRIIIKCYRLPNFLRFGFVDSQTFAIWFLNLCNNTLFAQRELPNFCDSVWSTPKLLPISVGRLSFYKISNKFGNSTFDKISRTWWGGGAARTGQNFSGIPNHVECPEPSFFAESMPLGVTHRKLFAVSTTCRGKHVTTINILCLEHPNAYLVADCYLTDCG